MSIFLQSKRKKLETIQKVYPTAIVLDLTSNGEMPWIKFSPFYPHGRIPIPFSPGFVAESVEGIWQGLKVFESTDIDVACFAIKTMKGIKRTERRYGKVLGHRQGVTGESLLSYREARYQIYLPVYKWVLDNCLQTETVRLRQISHEQDIVLLDYETNSDIDDLTKPLSHVSLVVRYIEDKWPRISTH